ncbi:MAG: FAD-binding and (Fe-S)-binding domain-containing protein [Actinomycetota bacterium]
MGESDLVRTDAATRTIYATDNSIYQIRPSGVAFPRTAHDVSVLLAANARGHRRPVAARGAGTGTNGQSLTDGLALDLKRHLHEVVSVDPDARTAVVQPGVVAGALNAELASHGLFWAPHTSTLNRCTVGGMISTDAAGKGSLVHGRTHRHVRRLDVVLDDGTEWTAEPTSVADAEARARIDDRVGQLWRDLLALPIDEHQSFDLPELARGFSGYGIDRLRRHDLIDPVALLCGAEGTLGVITEATLDLTPIPRHTVLIVASYASFADALDDSVDMAVTKPTAIESFDETTLERGRSSPAWPALGRVVGDHAGSVLLIEYASDTETDVVPIVETLQRTGRSLATAALWDPAERAAAWKVRADAVGLLAKVATGGPDRDARPTAFVEDCAVPVRAMPAFIAEFRQVLDQAGVTYGMFGHADVGCVHVRPALDLTDPEHEAMVRSVTDEVVALVARHGGVLWGEHGRGLRGDPVSAFLSPDTIDVMRRVKAAFDPGDLLNPGKLYRPIGSEEPLIRLDDAPLRGQANRQVPVELRREFSDAFACNGNGLCHHHDGAEVMCPSYKASGDPALSPKGRADLLRAWLRADATDDHAERDELGAQLAQNLHQCLSCSACSGRCPIEVDIPELKSQFLDRHHQRHRRPLAHHVLSRFERLATLGARMPQPIVRIGARAAGSMLGLVDLPTPSPATGLVRRLPRFDAANPTELVVMPDVFTSVLDPTTLVGAVASLQAAGHTVSVGSFVPSGKFDHVKGRRQAFARAVEAQAQEVKAIRSTGAQPVVVEPAIALLHQHEYPNIAADYPCDDVASLADVLDRSRHLLPPSDRPRRVQLLGHCTERATAPDSLAAWGRVLTAVGHEVATPSVGCCGMAGIFGHERENQEMSKALFEQTWAPVIRAAADERGTTSSAPSVVATGYSCRSQANRFAGARLGHPVILVASAVRR